MARVVATTFPVPIDLLGQIEYITPASTGCAGARACAGLMARLAGIRPAQAILTGAGAAGTVMAIFFAAVSAYR